MSETLDQAEVTALFRLDSGHTKVVFFYPFPLRLKQAAVLFWGRDGNALQVRGTAEERCQQG